MVALLDQLKKVLLCETMRQNVTKYIILFPVSETQQPPAGRISPMNDDTVLILLASAAKVYRVDRPARFPPANQVFGGGSLARVEALAAG